MNWETKMKLDCLKNEIRKEINKYKNHTFQGVMGIIFGITAFNRKFADFCVDMDNSREDTIRGEYIFFITNKNFSYQFIFNREEFCINGNKTEANKYVETKAG